MYAQEFFTKPEIINLSNQVVNSLGIYYHRWGDAPLRYMTLAMFANRSQVLKRSFDYQHPCDGPPDGDYD